MSLTCVDLILDLEDQYMDIMQINVTLSSNAVMHVGMMDTHKI